MWSLKQLRRHTSVPRTKTHWDSVLDEMKWMRTDFKEERKWKVASAYMIGRAVMEWHQASDKSIVCVATRIPASLPMDSGPVEDAPINMAPPETKLEDRNELRSEPTDIALGTDDVAKGIAPMDTSIVDTASADSVPVDISQTIGLAMDMNYDTTTESHQPVTSPNDNDTGLPGTDTNNSVKVKLEQHEDKDSSADVTPSTPPLYNSTPDDEESDDAQKQMMSATWELLYQRLIKDCDPYHTVITLPMEDFQHMDIATLFPDCLMYTPPDPNMDDPYFNEAEYGRIVPLTKLSTLKIRPRKRGKLNTRKRTIDGQPMNLYKLGDEVETLPNNSRYDSTLMSRKS